MIEIVLSNLFSRRLALTLCSVVVGATKLVSEMRKVDDYIGFSLVWCRGIYDTNNGGGQEGILEMDYVVGLVHIVHIQLCNSHSLFRRH